MKHPLHHLRRSTDPITDPSKPSPKGLFSRALEQQARAKAWSDVWEDNKLMVVAFYLIDIGGALVRAVLHVMLWVPAVVLWPLLLSSNGLAPASVIDWVMRVGGGGWDGALMKLIGAVFIISLCIQLLQGSVGARLRRHVDRRMERSLVWNLVETQLPFGKTAAETALSPLEDAVEPPAEPTTKPSPPHRDTPPAPPSRDRNV